MCRHIVYDARSIHQLSAVLSPDRHPPRYILLFVHLFLSTLVSTFIGYREFIEVCEYLACQVALEWEQYLKASETDGAMSSANVHVLPQEEKSASKPRVQQNYNSIDLTACNSEKFNTLK